MESPPSNPYFAKQRKCAPRHCFGRISIWRSPIARPPTLRAMANRIAWELPDPRCGRDNRRVLRYGSHGTQKSGNPDTFERRLERRLVPPAVFVSFEPRLALRSSSGDSPERLVIAGSGGEPLATEHAGARRLVVPPPYA